MAVDAVELKLPNLEHVIGQAYTKDKKQTTQAIEQHSWVSKGHPLGKPPKMDWELGFLLLGDGHISGTPLEGYEANKSTAFFQEFLDQVLKHGGEVPHFEKFKGKLTHFRNEMGSACTFANKFDAIALKGKKASDQERAQLVDDAAAELLAAFQKKKTGWIPCGWKTKNGESHAMMAHIDMQQGLVTVVNTGGGVSQHHSTAKVGVKNPVTGAYEDQLHAQEFVTYEGVDPERMNSKEFFKLLIELETRPNWDGQLDFNASTIYAPLKDYFKAKRQPAYNPNQNPLMYRPPQKSGTCAIQSISASLYYSLTGGFDGYMQDAKEGADCYAKLEYLWKTQALVSLMSQVNNQITGAQRRLLEAVMEEVCREAEGLFRQKKLSTDEFDALRWTVIEIRSKLDELEDKDEIPQTPSLKGEGPHESMKNYNVSGDTTDLLAIHKKENTDAVKPPEEPLHQLFGQPIPTFDPKNPFASLKIIEDAMDEFFNYPYPPTYNNGINCGALRKEWIRRCGEMIKSLPDASRKGNSFWKSLPKDQVVPCMRKIEGLLYHVARMCHANFSNSDNSHQEHTPTTTVLTYALYAINIELARSLKETELDGFELNYQDLINEVRSPHFILKDPGLQTRLESVIRFFLPKYSFEDLQKKDIERQEGALFTFKDNGNSGLHELDGEAHKSHPFARYYLPFLSEIQADPTLKEKLYALGKNGWGKQLTYADSLLDHLVALMTTASELLPESVRLLQQSALRCSALHFKGYSNLEPSLPLEAKVVKKKPYTVCVSVIDWKGHEPSLNTVYDKHLTKMGNSSLLKDFREKTTQNGYVLQQNVHFDQGLAISRQIEMLGCDPYESVAHVAAFIKKQVNLLKHEDIQDLLRINIFRPGTLDAQLQVNPKITSLLGEAIKDAIEHYNQMCDLETCCFLAKLGQDVKAYARVRGVKPQMPDFRNQLLNEVFPHFIEDEEVLRGQMALVSFYEIGEPENLTECAEDLLGLSVLLAFCNKIKTNPLASHARSIQLRFLPKIEALLDQNQSARDSILNGLIGKVSLKAQKYSWKKKTPNFECDQYSINIHTGEIIDKAMGAFTLVPQFIRENDDFQKLFQGKVVSCQCLEDGKTYVINKGLENALVVRADQKGIHFQKTLFEKEYRYVGEAKHNAVKDRFARLKDPSLQHWARNLGDGNGELIAVTADLKPQFRISYKKNSVLKQVTEVRRYDQTGALDMNVTWHPFEKINKEMQLLEAVEQKHDNIECWINKEGKIQEVNLPRMGLSIVAKKHQGERYLFCEQHPGYFLVQNPDIPSLEKVEGFLTLQNRSGARKVLVPRTRLKVKYKADPFDLEIEQSDEAKPYFLEYELKEGDLSSRRLEPQIYLIYLRLKHRAYHEAHKLLKQVRGLDRFIDDDEENTKVRTILEWIQYACSDSPAAVTLGLKLAIKVEENALKYPLAINSKPEAHQLSFSLLLKGYESYHDLMTKVSALRLSEQEEREVFAILLRRIEEKTEENKRKKMEGQLWTNLKERYKYLTQGKGKLGAFRVSKIETVQMTVSGPSTDDLNHHVTYQYGKVQPTLPLFSVQNGKYFEGQFFVLYQTVKHGSDVEKARLSKLLDLNRNSYSRVLKRVLQQPEAYPSYDAFIKAVKDKHKAYFFWMGLPYGKEAEEARKIFQQLEQEQKDLVKKLNPQDPFVDPCIVEKTIEKKSTDFGEKPAPKLLKKTPLACGSKELHSVDQAFDHYFSDLFEEYFTVQEKAAEVSSETLPTKHPNPNVLKKLKLENADLAAFRFNQPKKEKIYSLKVDRQLSALQSNLQQTTQMLQERLKTQKVALLWQLNHVPEMVSQRASKQVHQLGFREHLSWEDLRELTLEGNLEAFCARTHLGASEVKRLVVGVSSYLIQASRLDQIQSVLKAIAIVDAAEDAKKQAHLLRYVANALQVVRAYQPETTNFQYQWFEVANHFQYRKMQLQKLDEFTNKQHREILGEAPTGFGKTKALIPSLNQKKSEEGKLVFNTFPASLEMTNAVDLKEQMGASYGKQIDRLYFDRSTRFTSTTLKALYDGLLASQKKGEPTVIRSETLRVLELHALLTMEHASKSKKVSPELEMRIAYFIKILRLIRVEGWTTIDEAHINLDPRLATFSRREWR